MSATRSTALTERVTVISERLEGVRSVALGWFLDTGSVGEEDGEEGYAHLLEHMLFRGTRSYGSSEIDERFDAMGGEINAGTGKESTTLHCRVLDSHSGQATAITAEMVLSPLLREQDVEQEREIVIEEIAMYEDDPSDLVHELMTAVIFTDSPLGRPVIGTRASVGAANATALRDYHARNYGDGRVVVAAAGAVDHDRLCEQIGNEFAAATTYSSAGKPATAAITMPQAAVATSTQTPTARVLVKDTEQVHICVGGLSIAQTDERRFALRLLDTIIGGIPSSRLFQEVREQRGLAYSIYSYSSAYATTGQIGVYVGTRPDNAAAAVSVIHAELERICAEGPTTAELDRAREYTKGRIALGLEATSARMHRLGASVLVGLPLLDFDELKARFDAVSNEQLTQLARDLLAPERLDAAAVGPDGTVLRGALRQFNADFAEVVKQ